MEKRDEQSVAVTEEPCNKWVIRLVWLSTGLAWGAFVAGMFRKK